ncbi:SGNH/GDSL hydrolase family protein [Aquiflexum sp.]|uniref:SGNH/GDSL hydrolase family protein n=1 Tax=Aquiflexum sp. TaxID=1872584 RepID=UPI0035933041
MTLKKTTFLFLLKLFVVSVLSAQEGRKVMPPVWEKAYPQAPVPDNTSEWGKHIQRTMTLLATSTPEKRNTVRILFYGQSITANKKWTDAVVSDLIDRFPHAHIIYENRAIGGFSSQYLVNSSESDMYPFYPDLVIFHVYGAHEEYQEIIHNLRSRTTAEVAIVSDHLGAKEYDGKEFYDPGDWNNFMRKTFIPAVAEEYKAQLIDITTPWKGYLKSNNLTSQALLSDGIHPNDHGCFLMSELVKRELVYLPDHPKDEWKEMVKEYSIGKDVNFKKGKLKLDFDGNRVDVVAGDGPKSVKLNVKIDGKKPSEIKGCYTFTRSSGSPGVDWPALIRIDAETLPLIEDWKLTVEKVNVANTDFTFRVEGSRTGLDGTGNSLEKFISNTGRVVIEPGMWMNLERDFQHKGIPLTDGFEITWSVKPLFVDQYQPVEIKDPSKVYFTTLAQNLTNEKHLLELTIKGKVKPEIKTIRVYTPPVKGPMKLVVDAPKN